MTFKRKILFLLFSSQLMVSCGLELWEESPSNSSYRGGMDLAFCTGFLYRKAFYSYFMREEDSLEGNHQSGKNWRQALICVAKKIDILKTSSKQENLNRSELKSVLSRDDVMQKNGIVAVTRHINQPENFENYLLLKSALAHLIREKKAGRFVSAEHICRQPVEEPVLTQPEMDFFADFLEEMSDFFLEIEETSHKIMEDFFKKNGLVSKSSIEESDKLKKKFLSFLQNYLEEDFPGYANFLGTSLKPEESKESTLSSIKGFVGKNLYLPWTNFSKRQKETHHLRSEITQPLLDIMRLPAPSSDKITAQSVKYLLLNIYALQALFSAFDRDKNGELSPDEQHFIYCMTYTIVSIVVPPRLKDESDFVKWFHSIDDMSHFIMHEQGLLTINGNPKLWIYRLKRSFSSEKPKKTLSYTDVSRFVTLLFYLTFESIPKEELP